MEILSGQIRLSAEDEAGPRTGGIRAPTLLRGSSGLVAIAGAPVFDGKLVTSDSDAERLLGAYAESGTDILRSFGGRFAIVVLLPDERRCLMAIDRLGIERLAWAFDDDTLTFGKSAENVARQHVRPCSLNQQSVFDFMLGHMVPSPLTAFDGVHKLGPGGAVEICNGRLAHLQYWNPGFDRESDVSESELRQAVLPTLLAAIQRTRPDATTGSFLSGGLDSSTVTGLLAEANPASANAFSVGFGVQEFDELEFARAASDHFNCRHFTFEVTAQHIVDSIPKVAAAFDEPFGNSSAVPTYYCAMLAREHGVDHLLAGDGGDEIFGGNERYTRHTTFELYGKVPSLVRKGLLDPLAGLLDPEAGLLPLRKFASYVRQANIPLPERFESWNLIYREGPGRVFSPDFLGEVEAQAPLRRMAEVWNSCPSDDLLDRMLWYDWKYTLADSDIRKVTTMSELAGVRVSYPMLDDEFVDLSIRVPSSAKIVNRELRSFFRSAVKPYLPAKIIEKNKHGFGLPFGQWLKVDKNLQDLVYSSLDSLRKRQIFDSQFVDRVAAEHRDGHASYYGYAIWDLVLLEQWFQQHQSP